MALQQEIRYTVADIYALPENRRAELIDGVIYDMGAPLRIHQDIVAYLTASIWNYIRGHGGPCRCYPAPFAVTLKDDDYNYFEPDVSVICDPSKLTERGCTGAPDWILEVVSESSKSYDNLIKLRKYQQAGVRIYTIIDPRRETVKVFQFGENGNGSYQDFSFSEPVPSMLYEDLFLDFSAFSANSSDR